MEEKKGRLSSRWQSAYRRTSIQMILSASFTAVAVLGIFALAVMELPEGVGFSLPEAEYRTHTATAAAGCNRAVGEVSPAQYEAAVVNLHLAERRRVGHTVTLERDGKAVSAAAVTDCGTRYGQISYVATLPEYEGQGYGRAVVYHCAGWLQEKNLIPLVACEAHRESFYAGLGFQKISEVTVFTG